jgi:hypothetical protein
VSGAFAGRQAAGRRAGGPGVVVEQLAFERAEETLGQRVVPALAGPPVREPDLVVVSEGGEVAGGVLAAMPLS